MSTIKVTNIQNPSSGTDDIQIDANGDVTIGGLSLDAAAAADSVNLDASGRLLVGTATANGSVAGLQVAGSSGEQAVSIYSTFTGSSLTNGTMGAIRFYGGVGGVFDEVGHIECTNDGTHALGDKPTKLVFSTTAAGETSPTERMRIDSNGEIIFSSNGAPGVTLNQLSIVNVEPGETRAQLIAANREEADANAIIVLNRQISDGRLVQFRQANTTEGTISVSGTTVTYGGGHIARWSQLPNDEDPSSILKGTVMSNLDEMCEWGDEDNEQLNKTKISDVEGDPNVAGVFVATSFDEEGPKDFFVAMTGDMVIRIAASTTVKRGDLLMSAGDGTAKPQDDDIIRSKTIAKVTSTNVSCTYDDGSYCVPCVLMAC